MAKKKLKGIIKRISGKNTVAVEVTSVYHHPLYRKRIRTSEVHLAQADTEVAKVGEQVIIEETRPISKSKHFQVIVVGGKPLAALQQVESKSEKVKSKESGAKSGKAKRK